MRHFMFRVVRLGYRHVPSGVAAELAFGRKPLRVHCGENISITPLALGGHYLNRR
jgi:hypothetical protein